MKPLLALAASTVVLLSGCAVAEQARDMTPSEKAAAAQIAEVAGFKNPEFVSKRDEVFGGNYKESISFRVSSGTSDPYSPLVEPYRNLVSTYPEAEVVPRPGALEGAPVRCVESSNAQQSCAFVLVLTSLMDGKAQTLRVGVSADSDGEVGMSVVPYYSDSAYPPYPAPPTIPPVYAGDNVSP